MDGSFSIRLMDGSLEMVVPRDQLASGYQDRADNEARNLVSAVLAAVDARFNGSQDTPSARTGETTR